MQTNSKFITLAFVLTLSLCLSSCTSHNEDELSSKIASLTLDNAKLNQKFDIVENEFIKKTDVINVQLSSLVQKININEKDAGIAEGCDWLIPLCPNSFVERGRPAIKEGYTPDPFWFWIYAFLKFAVFGLLVSVIVGGLKLLNIILIMPSNQYLIEAKETIQIAKNFMLTEKDQLQAEINELTIMTREKWSSLERLDEDIQSKQETQIRVKKEIAKLNKMKDFLTTNLIA